MPYFLIFDIFEAGEESMEAMAVPRAQATALLLEHAFGRRLMDGEDEWSGVDSVVRSSFLLLYREFRRQEKRLRVVEAHHVVDKPADDTRLPLVCEQLQLLKEELQLLKSELRDLQVSGTSCKCCCGDGNPTALSQQIMVTQIAVQTQRQRHRYQKLRHKISKLQRQVQAMRRVQHESEEIVVRTAEKQQRQTQSLFKKICGDAQKRERLEQEIELRVRPRLRRLEKHVVAMHRKLKARKHLGDAKEDEAGGCGEERGLNKEEEVEPEAPPERTDQGPKSTRVCYPVSPPSSPVFASRRPLDVGFLGSTEGEEDELLLDRRSPLAVPTAHASLRLRYQHERKRQIGRLDRLRRTKILPRPLTAPQYEERSVIG